MANQLPDFSMERQLPLGELASIIANKPVKEQQMNLAAEENRRDRYNQVLGAVKAGQDIVKNSIEISAARQRDRAIKDLAGIMGEPPASAPVTKPFTKYGPAKPAEGPFGPDGLPFAAPEPIGTVQPTFGQTQQGQTRDSRLMEAATRVDPETAARSVFTSQTPKSPGVYDVLQRDMTDTRTGKSKTVWIERSTKRILDTDGVTPIPPEEARYLMPTFAPKAIGGTDQPIIVPNIPGAVSTNAVGTPRGQGRASVSELQKPEADRLDGLRSALAGDGVLKDANDKITELRQAEALVNTENWLGDATLLSTLAKGVGRDAGALSNQDLARIQASPEVVRRIRTNVNRWTKGVVTPEDREDIRKAIQISVMANEKRAEERKKIGMAKANRTVRNLDQEFLRDYLYGDFERPSLPEAGAKQPTHRWNPQTKQVEEIR